MAISNTGMTLYTNNDNEGGWGGTDGPDDYDNAIQGTNSESWQVSKNSTETGTLTKTANMGTSKYFTFYMSSNLAPYYTNAEVNIRTNTTNYENFEVATSTDRKLSGDFHPVVIQFGEGTTTGTLNKTSITSMQIVIDNSSSGNIRSVINNWIDTMWYGNGRTINGTTASDNLFLESHTADTTTNDSYDGCSELYKGSLAFQTDITIATTTGKSYGESVVFASGYNTDDAYTVTVTGTVEFKGTNLAGAGATVALDTTGSTSFDMAGGSITNGGDISLKSGNTIDGVVFSGCSQIDTNGATMSTSTISNTTETTTGSLVVNSSSEAGNITDMQFNGYSVNSRYAIYVPSGVTSFTMDNWQFDDPNNTTDYALYWAGTAGTLTISSVNGTNLSVSGCTSAGGTISISQNVTIEISNVAIGSRVGVDTIDGNGNLSTNLILEEASTSTVSTSVNYAGLDYTAVSIRVRKSSGGTKYLPYKTFGTITSGGLTVSVSQVEDTIAN